MKEQVITFAALCQIAHQVQMISRGVPMDDAGFEISLNSIIQMSPENTLAVYGGELSHLKDGLSIFINHLSDSTNKVKDPEITRYIVGLINLERRLAKKPKKLSELGSRIQDTQRQLEHFSLTSEPLLANFASIYSDIISPLGARIQVMGEPSILKQTNNQYKIRALLLAGIRAAVLWRQVGGKRRNILFKRSKLVHTAKELLATI
ncbi:MAG: high frequency lysogenization protein HflD [Colwellia sp.]